MTAVAERPRRLLRRLATVSMCVGLVAATTADAAAENLDDTARFLAGKGVSWSSDLADQAQAPSYAEYASQIAASWKQFQEPNIERMRTWWKGHGPARYGTVFYPFGGPDIENALVLFPDAEQYVLFGLEDPGTIPDLTTLDEAEIGAGLSQLAASLSTLFKVNYFFTRAMEKKLGKGAFNSVSSLLLYFLATNDCEVTGARRIAIGRGGAVVTASADAAIPGVEITFHRERGKDQTIRYFMVNVADAALAKTTRDFATYVESQPRFTTMIKSASYLMHKEGSREPTRFARIRSLILERSDFIVQDDSGIPLRLFARDVWKLRFHGKYAAPTPEFARYLQKDLRVEIQRNTTGALPFSYGYAYQRGESNLMTAERAR